ncbi:unnamed protein product [Paramecium octaurelia]|uniref:Uncharacterized protein n=1 Tax=Paramecium octaurelia TaxID=43137 RepID=A0A8S1UNS5_PAROT|nr:unnamed protein product [Paramecium octaurelia]
MHEFQQAQFLMNTKPFSQAHNLHLRQIQILKPHDHLAKDLLYCIKMVQKSDQNYKMIFFIQLDPLGNILQYLQTIFITIQLLNQIYLLNMRLNLQEMCCHMNSKVLKLSCVINKTKYNYALLSSPYTKEELISIIEYSEVNLIKDCLQRWRIIISRLHHFEIDWLLARPQSRIIQRQLWNTALQTYYIEIYRKKVQNNKFIIIDEFRMIKQI